jgi:hypothetical protein
LANSSDRPSATATEEQISSNEAEALVAEAEHPDLGLASGSIGKQAIRCSNVRQNLGHT